MFKVTYILFTIKYFPTAKLQPQQQSICSHIRIVQILDCHSDYFSLFWHQKMCLKMCLFHLLKVKYEMEISESEIGHKENLDSNCPILCNLLEGQVPLKSAGLHPT